MTAPVAGWFCGVYRPLLPAWAWTGVAGLSLRFAIENSLVLAVLFAAYQLPHRALRLRLVERLVVATSLTHFRRWRRYRAPRPGSGSRAPQRASERSPAAPGERW